VRVVEGWQGLLRVGESCLRVGKGWQGLVRVRLRLVTTSQQPAGQRPGLLVRLTPAACGQWSTMVWLSVETIIRKKNWSGRGRTPKRCFDLTQPDLESLDLLLQL
jgi:hypothetical protein